jgi:hypothetical protein
MTASHLLALCFVLTAYGADLGPPLGFSSMSASEVPTNVSAYQTTQSTAKVIASLAGFTDCPVSPGRPRNYPQAATTPLVRLATSPRPPPRFTDSTNPDHADPTPNICSAEDESVPIRNEMFHPAGHYPDISDKQDFMKRLTGGGQKKDAKPKIWTPGQTRMWILFAKKDALANMRESSPELFYTMTRTCTTPTTPAYHSNIPPPPPPPLLTFFCELLYIITLSFISAALLLSTACAFGLAKAFDKLTGVRIPCQLLFIFLTLFPAPGVAATQGLANQSSIQVAVYTNASASTSMIAVDTVASWAQLVTACAAPSANITLSPAFQMGAYTNEIDFSGKVIIIFGSNATLDAGQKGRFFSGDGSKGRTSLELHGITLKNGKTFGVSKHLMYIKSIFEHI